MSEEYEPGRPGRRVVVHGPALATVPNYLCLQERYADHWSRVWAISYDLSQGVPSDATMGWWLAAEFDTRQETADWLNQTMHVWGGNTTMVARRRRAEFHASVRRCPQCGGTVLKVSDDTANVVCDACGHDAPLAMFERKPA